MFTLIKLCSSFIQISFIHYKKILFNYHPFFVNNKLSAIHIFPFFLLYNKKKRVSDNKDYVFTVGKSAKECYTIETIASISTVINRFYSKLLLNYSFCLLTTDKISEHGHIHSHLHKTINAFICNFWCSLLYCVI